MRHHEDIRAGELCTAGACRSTEVENEEDAAELLVLSIVVENGLQRNGRTETFDSKASSAGTGAWRRRTARPR
jgi:hypothetical protein